MATIVGIPYTELIRDLRGQVQARLIELPGRSLTGDWVAGYEDVLAALAREIPVPDGSTNEDSVSLIGLFMDRTEQDHLGNVRELERLLRALDLEVDAVWLSGQPFARLATAARSRTLVALPMGQAAASVLAARTGATVVECEVPLGLEQTQRWLRAVAAATGRQALAETVIEEELRRLLPRVEWVVPQRLLGSRVAFSGAPDQLGGFHQLATELGMQVVHLSSPAKPREWVDGAWGDAGPLMGASLARVTEHVRAVGPDLMVGPTSFLGQLSRETAFVEHGFPGHTDHALADRPFLGFRGYLRLVERMATALAARLVRSG